MRRAVLASLALAVSAIGLVVVACSFPSVTFAPDDAAPGSAANDSPSSSSGATSSTSSGATSSGTTTTSSSSSGTTSSSSGSSSGADGACSKPCDCDDDGVNAVGGTCNGKDCDDHDKRAYLGQPSFIDASADGGDWDCNGTVEKYYDGGVNCAVILDGGLLTYNVLLQKCAHEGFTGDPGCGVTGDFVTCVPNSAVNVSGDRCVAKDNMTIPKAQACR